MNPAEIEKLKAGAANAYDFGYPKTPAQIASTITVDNLTKPAPTPLPVPDAPAPNTGYGSAIEQGNSKIGSFQMPSDDLATYKSLFGSLAEDYQKAQNSPDILAQQQEAANRKNRVRRAQAELTNIQSEIAGFTEQAKAEERALLKNAEGGLVTSAIFSRQRAKVQEMLAEKVLPYNSRILAKQAEIMSLQGDAEMAQQLLSESKQQLNELFRLKSEDAARFYTWQKDMYNKAYEIARDDQKIQLQRAEKEVDRKYQIQDTNTRALRDLADKASDNRQPELASRIALLKPDSPTFNEEYARLQGELKTQKEWSEPYTLGGDLVQKNLKTGEIRTAVNVAGVTDGTPSSGTLGRASNPEQQPYYDAFNSAVLGLPQFSQAAARQTFKQYMDEGDLEGARNYMVRAATQGLPAADQTQALGRAQATASLKEIESLLQQAKAAGSPTNILSGSLVNVAQRLGTSTDQNLSYLGARMQQQLQVYRRSMTGVAFSPGESKEYKKIFPDITNINDLNTTKIQALTDSFDSNNRATLAFLIGDQNYEKIFGTPTLPTLPDSTTKLKSGATGTTSGGLKYTIE